MVLSFFMFVYMGISKEFGYMESYNSVISVYIFALGLKLLWLMRGIDSLRYLI